MTDAQVKILIKRIHMRHEWIGVSSTGRVLQDGNIYFNKTIFVQVITSCLPKLRTAHKTIAYILVDVHINITATQALFFIRELCGHRTQRLGQKAQRLYSDRYLEVEQTENRSRGIDKLWKNIRKDVVGPVWLINTPKFISPLAKSNPNDDRTVQRFQPVIAGSELGNGFSELNDPIDQLNRFVEQQNMRDAGDDEAMMLDIDYVEMLEYGMPPACGWGNSERVFWIFEGVTAREGVPFPQLRVEYDATTRDLHPHLLSLITISSIASNYTFAI